MDEGEPAAVKTATIPNEVSSAATTTAEPCSSTTVGLLSCAAVMAIIASSTPANDATPMEGDDNNNNNNNNEGCSSAAIASAKTLKRCLSVPIIHTLPSGQGGHAQGTSGTAGSSTAMTTRSAAAAAAAAAAAETAKRRGGGGSTFGAARLLEKDNTPKKYQSFLPDTTSGQMSSVNLFCSNISIPRSNPCSREVSPAPVFNIFAPRARRYSASYSPLGATVAGTAAAAAAANAGGAPLCVTPRVSQLRKEECVDMNSREVNHEREVHSAMQMSQSWEDLTLVAENWSCKSDEFSNPLQVVMPNSMIGCSSPSPTSNRGNIRLPYGLSPSPTRRTFATRRSMSPIAMRPSQLGPVKRKFELEENSSSNWNVYSPPPLKKIFTESRGSSPVCQSPSSVCPSPDSGTYDGRITPKLFISKLCTTGLNSLNAGGATSASSNSNNNNNNSSSACSSPMSASPSSSAIDSTATAALCSSSSSSMYGSSAGSEPMCIGGSSSHDEGISISDAYDKSASSSSASVIVGRGRPDQAAGTAMGSLQAMPSDLQDDATLMDDMKSETSSIGGCSSISIESSSCDSGAKAAAGFFHKLAMDDPPPGVGGSPSSGPLGQKSFFINKQGITGPRKFIVNHDNLQGGSGGESLENSIKMSSTTTALESSGMKTRRSNVRSIGGDVPRPAAERSAKKGSDTDVVDVGAGAIFENKL